ncbi:MAG: flagellar export chaperone FlgN [Planctomycetota bacterium]|nr:flagellar export chaperone FlgN [Planctomycetaceae bacterium]MDQ3332804.1 flagellar export chaperone FlgN [Planctomycetota bacterium]
MNADLAAGFRTSLGDYVARLESLQSELLTLYRKKHAALAAADIASIQQTERPERAAADRLKAMTVERHQLLMRAGQFDASNGSLAEVAIAVGCDAELHERIEKCRRRSTTLRREGWVHWVVAKRSLAQNAALIDLIAHHGNRPPTYEKSVSHSGGTLLDTTA